MKTKENKAMRLASVLLVLTLLATSLTAGTFAKYTTGESGTATAKVAKFGVEVTADATNIFGEKYKKDGFVTAEDANITVKAESDVVAPGTKGSMEFSVTGTPETAVELAVSITGIKPVMLKGQTYKTSAGNKIVTADYNPIKWTLTKDSEVVTGYQNVSLTQINDYFSSNTFIKEYNAGTDLKNNINYTLSWEWSYDNNSNGTNDDADTILGDISAESSSVKKADDSELEEGTDYNLEEAFTFNIKVTQAD